ncbi:uncharacterized protein ARMOST_10409 [Armillaria ostoyae]|uniref:Uncharacterized protein n=1 Tax=Armillaria ostoyae TaxID=47428 RepID=A0A284RE91_ARMOS|nr:uncharacterized protein ARMOST_10409 [Armillaria ostoyae]
MDRSKPPFLRSIKWEMTFNWTQSEKIDCLQPRNHRVLSEIPTTFEKVAESAVDDTDSCRVFMLDLNSQTFEFGQKGIMAASGLKATDKWAQANDHLFVPEPKVQCKMTKSGTVVQDIDDYGNVDNIK